MASTRAYFRGLALIHTDVGAILTLTNRALSADIGEDRFVTSLLARLEPVSRTLTYGNAGHPTGYLFGADGAVKQQLASSSVPLGIFPDQEFATSAPVPLAPGDLVLLATDGIVETRSPDNEPFGTERMLQQVRQHRDDPARHVVEALYDAVRDFARQAPQLDDITAVVVKALAP
jgi:sigma-B regulation protein RsbU (phosphoserine phosphatase)